MTRPRKQIWKHWPALIFGVALVWMLVNLLTPVSCLIVLANQSGYQSAVLTIEKIYHQNDFEAGLAWGFHGRIAERAVRLFAPELANAKQLGFSGLTRKFPPGSQLQVWYNPDVTDTLFDHRTLRVLPWAEDLGAVEAARLFWWFKYCLLPFILAWFVIARWKKHSLS